MAYTTIDNPELYFQVKTYTGTGSSNAITLDGSEDMQPDWIAIKRRNAASGTQNMDSVRGAAAKLAWNETSGEESPGNILSSFNSNGFTVGDSAAVNGSSDTFVAWCWKETATAGFDIVDYDGDGSIRTVSHSLSAVPHVIITKVYERNGENWAVYHHKNTSDPETDYLILNGTNATADQTNYWNDTAPTSSVFTVGGQNDTNASGQDIIGYLWTGKQGYSKFGSYIGNGSSSANSGTFVYTGFKPSMVIVKSTASEGWQIWDNKRSSYNGQGSNISPNSSNAESTGVRVHFFSNGFQLVSSGADQNSSGQTFIYMAFAEATLVNSNGVPCNAR